MPHPSKKQLATAYQKAVGIHRDHLLASGVNLPKWGTAKSYWLAILMHYSPDAVHKDTISDIIREHLPELGRDQQVRHLKRDGWNVESPQLGMHQLSDPYRADSGFTRELVRRQSTLLAGDFEGIKKAFGNKCATCGAREGEPDPRYGSDAVRLQQGHRDPAKPQGPENTIPQCQFCNQAYKDDFTFDGKGRVRAVASVAPVRRASTEVQDKIKKFLAQQNKKKRSKKK